MSELITVILAAGKGTRMKSKLPKVLHKAGGKPMLQHVIDAAKGAGAKRSIAVVGFEAEMVREAISVDTEIVVQAEQLGTGHAVLQTAEALKDEKEEHDQNLNLNLKWFSAEIHRSSRLICLRHSMKRMKRAEQRRPSSRLSCRMLLVMAE